MILLDGTLIFGEETNPPFLGIPKDKQNHKNCGSLGDFER